MKAVQGNNGSLLGKYGTGHVNTLCGSHARFLNVTAGGMYRDHYVISLHIVVRYVQL